MHLSIDLTKLLEMQLTSSIGRETSGHLLFLFDGARHLLCCKIEYQLKLISMYKSVPPFIRSFAYMQIFLLEPIP